jgi:hypothetical protein
MVVPSMMLGAGSHLTPLMDTITPRDGHLADELGGGPLRHLNR